MRIELHAHTTASDGVLTPGALAQRARQARLDVLAVTDHDTMDGVDEAIHFAAEAGPRIVPGIELSASSGGRHVHVLGLFCDPNHVGLREALQRFRADRLDRARRMAGVLSELGYPLTLDDVLAQSGNAVIARPHVARALVARGYFREVGQAFTPQLLGDGGPADVPRAPLGPERAIQLVREAGGVAVLAHPGVGRSRNGGGTGLPEELIETLASQGLAGLEVDHPLHPPAARDRLRGLARRLGLVATGGSDFHGFEPPGTRPLGCCLTLPDAFAALEALAATRPRPAS